MIIKGGSIVTKTRAYTVIIMSLVSSILLGVSFFIFILPNTPNNLHIAGYIVLGIFWVTLAICFIAGWIALDKINNPDVYEKDEKGQK
jgi:hypothetical protein